MGKKFGINWKRFSNIFGKHTGKVYAGVLVSAFSYATVFHAYPAFSNWWNHEPKLTKAQVVSNNTRKFKENFENNAHSQFTANDAIEIKGGTTIKQWYPPGTWDHKVVYNFELKVVAFETPNNASRVMTFPEFNNDAVLNSIMKRGCSIAFNLEDYTAKYNKIKNTNFETPSLMKKHANAFSSNYCRTAPTPNYNF